MSGIIFLKTAVIEEMRRFYIEEVGMTLWLDQGGCIILRHGNFLLGFCSAEVAETEGCITFYYDSKEEVDAMCRKFASISTSQPIENPKYRIYNFFARDPEGRTVEFQKFLHPLPDIDKD